MEQSPCSGTDSRSAGQEFPRSLTKLHHFVRKSPL